MSSLLLQLEMKLLKLSIIRRKNRKNFMKDGFNFKKNIEEYIKVFIDEFIDWNYFVSVKWMGKVPERNNTEYFKQNISWL